VRTRWFVGLALVLSWLLPASVKAQKKAPAGAAKVLLLSGGQRNHHGYRDQAFYLASALEDTTRFEVTIVEDAAILETPAAQKYDVVIMTADRRDPEFRLTPGEEKALFELIKAGRGYVSIHGADNVAKEWDRPAWREMLGGTFSHFEPRDLFPDSKTKKGTFTVKIVKTEDPVVRGLSDFEIKDELYYNLQMAPGVEPLATVDYQGQAWPAAWTKTYGQGRVFHTPLGHRDFGPGKDDPLRNPSLLKLVIQGSAWAAEGRVPPPAAPTSAK
jgi:type 1 glutamine amidotransferase